MRIEKPTFTEIIPPPRPITENLKARELPVNESLEQARKRAELNFAKNLRERSLKINALQNSGQSAKGGQENTPENEAQRLAQLRALEERIKKAQQNSR